MYVHYINRARALCLSVCLPVWFFLSERLTFYAQTRNERRAFVNLLKQYRFLAYISRTQFRRNVAHIEFDGHGARCT
jgi:putative flippase GtrA